MLEAYPTLHQPGMKAPSNAHMGLSAAFRITGFVEVARPGNSRRVTVRYAIKGVGGDTQKESEALMTDQDTTRGTPQSFPAFASLPPAGAWLQDHGLVLDEISGTRVTAHIDLDAASP